MNTQNILIPISGLDGIGSRSVSVILLVGKSGLSYIPLQCDSRGVLLTSGV